MKRLHRTSEVSLESPASQLRSCIPCIQNSLTGTFACIDVGSHYCGHLNGVPRAGDSRTRLNELRQNENENVRAFMFICVFCAVLCR